MEEFNAIGALTGGATAGGETLDLNPVQSLGYKEDIKVQDVKNVLSCFPTVAQIQEAATQVLLLQSGFQRQLGSRGRWTRTWRSLGFQSILLQYICCSQPSRAGSSVTCP